ncbi:hypothetical protein D3C79_819290 [compost metagenome]
MLAKVLRGRRLAISVQVIGACAQHIPLGADLPPDQSRILQVADAEGDVGALLHRVDIGIGGRQFNGQLRVLLMQAIEQPDDVQMGEGHRRVDPHQAANVAGLAADRFVGGIQQLQHFANLQVIALAGVSQLDRAGVAVQQLLPDLALKRGDEA